MSDDTSETKSNGHSNGEPEGTVLGGNAGVYIPSRDQDTDDPPAIGDEHLEVPADFGSFIVSLGTNCMINLGRVEHPETGGLTKDLTAARHTIDILEMLQDKTAGNLDNEEQKLLESLLYDLRSAFVAEKKAKN
jgi:hypothetical protein